MGLFDKVKNLFTEEVEEEVVKKETKHIEKPSIEIMERPERPVERPIERSIERFEEDVKPVEEKKQTREEKFVIFNDDDFKELERPKKEEIKEVKKEEVKPVAYKGAQINTEPVTKKEFRPSPIISPVYGVLNKNYEKEDIKPRKSSVYTRPVAKNIDDVRNKAFGNVEDDIKDEILGKSLLLNDMEEVREPDINIFEELDKYEAENPVEEIEVKKPSTVDEIFGKLNSKKEEILDELDEKKDAIIEEIDNKANDIEFIAKNNSLQDLDEAFETDDNVYVDNLLDDEDPVSDVEVSKQLLDDEEDIDVEKELLGDDDTDSLARELEEQKKKLAEINDLMDENEKATKTKSKKKKEVKEETLDESELFDILDSSYEKEADL